MAKIIVSIDASDEKRCAIAKLVADALGVLPGDVILIPAGASVTVVDVPVELVKARDKVASGFLTKDEAAAVAAMSD